MRPTPFSTAGVQLTQLFVVSDLERSKRFYRDVLGASLYREYGDTSRVLDLRGPVRSPPTDGLGGSKGGWNSERSPTP
jgi:catechol 2,3-dioxygenase-like lactoylglutathione lyase family enzyme